MLGLVGRREAALRDFAASLPNPNAVRIYAADVRDADAMHAAATDFLVHFGCPDVVIANAGISVGTVASEREDLDDFRLVMDTNWFGTLTTFQPFLHPMRERAPGVGGWRGTLVGIASVAGVRGPARRRGLQRLEVRRGEAAGKPAAGAGAAPHPRW